MAKNKNKTVVNPIPDRTNQILNITTNSAILLMGTMLGGMTDMIGNMGKAMAGGMTSAIAGEEEGKRVTKEIDKKIKKDAPEANAKIAEMIRDMKSQMDTQFEAKKAQIIPLIKDPVFDKGIEIVNKYDFKMPKISEKLDNETLAKYLILLKSSDPNTTEMFKEIMTWMNTLPKPKEEEKASSDDERVPKDVADEMDNETHQ